MNYSNHPRWLENLRIKQFGSGLRMVLVIHNKFYSLIFMHMKTLSQAKCFILCPLPVVLFQILQMSNMRFCEWCFKLELLAVLDFWPKIFLSIVTLFGFFGLITSLRSNIWRHSGSVSDTNIFFFENLKSSEDF